MELSITNISVDILTSFIFLLAVWRSIQAVYYNNLTISDRVYLGCWVAIGTIHIFQTLVQSFSFQSGVVWLWDVNNLVVVLLALSQTTIIRDRSGYHST